eukprot:203329_1
MQSQATQSTPSPQSPQPQDTSYPNDMNQSFQFGSTITNHLNPTPSILSLNGLLQNTQNTHSIPLIKSEEDTTADSNSNSNSSNSGNTTNTSTNTNGLLPPQFSGFPSSPYPPHQHHPFPQPPTISVRYPHNLYNGGPPPQFPPPPNTSSENKQRLMHYHPVMFPSMIPLNSNNQGIPLNIHHPPPLITNTPNNVINEDDIFGAKYSPNVKQIMIINQNTLNHPVLSANSTRKRGTKRKRNNSSEDEEDSNDSNDSNEEEEEEEHYYEDGANLEEGISHLITRPITKRRKINDEDHVKVNGRYFCTYCDKSFVQNCHLSRHIREKHASSRPSFECRICSKSFNQRSNLKVHLRSHALDESVSRPWLCSECYPNRRFTRKSSLKRHWVKKHKTISAQLISELDLSISNQSNAMATHTDTRIKNEHIKNEPVQSLRYEHGIYRIGDIEIPPEVFQPTAQHQHNNSLPPLVGN